MNNNNVPTKEEIYNSYKNITDLKELHKEKKYWAKHLHPDTQCIQSSTVYENLLKYSNSIYDEFLKLLINKSNEVYKDTFYQTGMPEIKSVMSLNNNSSQVVYYIPREKYWNKGINNTMFISKIFIPKEVDMIGGNAFRNTRWVELEFEKRGNKPITIMGGAFSQYQDFRRSYTRQKIINMPSNIIFKSYQGYVPFDNCKIDCFQIYSNYNFLMKGIYPQVTWIALNDIKKIESSMFSECSLLEKISETENIVEIGDYAFEGCNKLKQLYIPNITSVGKHVFKGCSSELKIYTKPDKLPLFANAFTDSFENHRDQFIV